MAAVVFFSPWPHFSQYHDFQATEGPQAGHGLAFGMPSASLVNLVWKKWMAARAGLSSPFGSSWQDHVALLLQFLHRCPMYSSLGMTSRVNLWAFPRLAVVLLSYPESSNLRDIAVVIYGPGLGLGLMVPLVFCSL